jgi:hypothetical protein
MGVLWSGSRDMPHCVLLDRMCYVCGDFGVVSVPPLQFLSSTSLLHYLQVLQRVFSFILVSEACQFQLKLAHKKRRLSTLQFVHKSVLELSPREWARYQLLLVALKRPGTTVKTW